MPKFSNYNLYLYYTDLRQNEYDGDIDQIVGGSKVPRGQHRYMVKCMLLSNLIKKTFS